MRLTELAHQELTEIIHPGDVVIDTCAGNGYDTLFLAQKVGCNGRVYAFDIQAEAIESTRRKLDNQHIERVQLIHANHADLAEFIPSDIRARAITFNLGYLPGADKTIATCARSTLTALNTCMNYLDNPAMISILAYRGHPGGEEEYQEIVHWVQSLTSDFTVRQYSSPNTRSPAPVLMLIKKSC